MGIIAAGQITVVDLSDAPVLNTFITASRPTTQTYSKDSGTYNPSYASTPQVLTLKLTKAGSTTNIIDSISSLHWFVVDGPIKTEITSKDNSANEYISGTHNEILTTKLDIDLNKGSKRYEVMGIWPDPSTGLDVQFGGYIDLLLTQNGATGPQGPQGDTGNGIANTVITYGLSMSDTTEPATWSSERPALVKGMYLWTRTVIIYTNGSSTTSYQISYIPQDADATAAIDKTKQELLEKLETVRDESLEAVDEAKQQLVTVRDESLAAAEEAKQGLANVNTKVDNAKAEIDKAKQDLTNVASELNTAKQDLADSVSAVNTKVDNAKEELTQAKQQLTTVSDDLSKAKTDFQNAVSAVDTKATNLKSDLTQAKQDLNSQAQQLQAQANAQSELTKRVSSVEKTANGTKTTVGELSKTVAQNGKDITSVTARTKTVEDDLAGTKTTLSQVKTTADSTSQKTATLETGLNGLNAKFDNLKIGGRNLLSKTNQGKTNWAWKVSSGETTAEDYNVDGINAVKLTRTSDASFRWDYIQYNGLIRKLIEPNTKYTLSFDVKPNVDVTFTAALQRGDGGALLTNAANMSKATANKWTKASCVLTSNTTLPDDLSQVVYLSGMPVSNGNWLIIKNIKLEKGNVATDYSPSEVDFEQKVAEYKQSADQNYASLQTTVQNLDGTVQHNKTVADQTAQGFTTRIESLETYKDGESERANAYFESAKTETAKQLTAERTAIAKDYVAKSTYTSDVTGIRNDLTATTTTANTTKTNLANYQASNDKVVASLKSSLQTTDGNVSNLQTKVEAVPGQITSAVSAVEGKIPTSSGGRNLAQGTSKDWSKPFTSFSGVQNTCFDLHRVITDGLVVGDTFKTRVVLKYTNIVPASGKTAKIWIQGVGNVTAWNSGTYPSGGGDPRSISGSGQFVFELTDKINADHLKNDYWTLSFRTDWIASGSLQWRLVKAERGMFFTDWSPAPEDAIEEISSLSSEIKQTADGMTLLATKTELNTAKNELQSGITTATNKANAAQSTANNNAQTISTHTTQISALNTGLQAKVSQSEFNTLSGRVTTAENNITAKANELSSKITSVEGKIPTSVGGRNLLSKTNQGKTNWSWAISSGGATAEDFDVDGVNAVKLTRISDASVSWSYIQYSGLIRKLIEPNTKYTLSFDVKPSVDVTFSASLQRGDGGAPLTNAASMNKATANQWTKVSCVLTSNTTLPDDLSQVVYLSGMPVAKGNYLIIKNIKLEKGVVSSDWSPAAEDAIEEISSLSSELKQTADGMTLLATKTELNTAKSDLQSGINTATNKANSAQSTANNNAQTISTHTTQISALNTGLQAKVSQTDFNTLSGRVTTAENNITAKANELSSKITSVEGKIPTSVGGRNLWIQSKVTGGFVEETLPDNHITGQKKCYHISNNNEISFNIEPDFSSRLYRKVTFSAWVKYDNVVQGTNSWNVFNCFKHELYRKNSSTGVTTNINHLTLEGFTGTSDWKHITYTYDYAADKSYDQLKTTIRFNLESVRSGMAWVTGVKIEIGSIPSDYSPAPEDTINQISSLSSELKQTKDGITLLATKTELNNAKNELQSGINTATNKANSNAQTISTHTTQISALNTGLQAKVSQTDFNTLSGRVTTAENNITAKANELSSKITSVEGKIPTNIGTVNLVKNTGSAFVMGYGITNTTWNETKKQSILDFSTPGVNLAKSAEILPQGNKFCDFKPIKGTTYTQSIMIDTDATFNPNGQMEFTWFANGQHNSQKGYIKKVGAYSYQVWSTYTWNLENTALRAFDLRNLHNVLGFRNSGTYLAFYKPKLTAGNLPSDWSPAPEDTISQISSLSSELSQTKDGITLLATKTELNTAKNELQSGINTATNKANSAQNTANNAQSTANSAQNTANSNAQTISTHTTQISALNTGLQAKVSQTDFNTLSGRVTTAENNITAKANELSSKITSIEGKIPTSVGGRNLLTKTNQGKLNWAWPVSSGGTTAEDFDVDGVKAVKLTRTSDSSVSWHYISYSGLIRKLIEPNTKYTLSFDVKPSVDVTFTVDLKRGDAGASLTNAANMNKALANKWTKVSCVLTSKATLSDDLSQVVYLSGMPITKGNYLIIKNIKLEKGAVPSDWSPAPEDTIEQISSLSSELKQTKDGITLLATKTELNNTKNELQSGINTATNKANSNAQTISTHTNQISALNTGLQAKVSQTDFNTLSGRVTTAENNITAKANELSSKISSVEGKLPTSVSHRNLVQGTSSSWSPFVNISTNTNWCYNLATIKYGDSTGIRDGTTINIFVYLSADELTLGGPSPSIRIQGMVIDKNGNLTWTNWDKYHPFKSKWSSNLVPGNNYRIVKLSTKVTKESYSNINGFEIGIRIDGVQSGKFHHRALMVTTGDIFPDSWSPAPEDAISQINSVSSEFKQTTDSIKASVTSLDKSTVKSSSLTINSDGIVMKAGKSTTDVANAIGSYFAVNQNAIDLFADKIKVKGNMIVSGSISSDKIASNGITASVIKGGTLQSTNGSTNFELNTGKLFYNNNNTGVFRVQNGASTMGLKFSNTSISVGGTSRILSRVIMGGDRRQTTLDDGKWDQGGFTGIVAETINGVGSDAHESADALRVIGDNIYFTHTYNKDVFTDAPAQGWKMETYSPFSTYTGNVVLKPYGINYRKSDIIVGDIRLDNGDGSGYWMRNTIQVLKNCFGHILNGGTSSNAMNAIRSELNKISGI